MRIVRAAAGLGVLAAVAVSVLTGPAHGVAARATSAAACVGAVGNGDGAIGSGDTLQAAPAAGRPCWVDVNPYPFGADGNPASAPCSGTLGNCLQVTSFAFRSWNRGLAVTEPTATSSTPYGVWRYNGSRWYPDPTFPGSSTCPGRTVLWAGKLDVWVIGGTRVLCRFDGAASQWEPFTLPAATLARGQQPIPAPGKGIGPLVIITTGACFAWDNCWFFGNYGSVVHWDGTELTDESPNIATSPALAGTYEDAVALTDAGGIPLGIAVANTRNSYYNQLAPPYSGNVTPLVSSSSAPPPTELFSSNGTSWSSVRYAPPTTPNGAADPYRTDLVAVAFGADDTGWAAGDPAGSGPPQINPTAPADTPEAAPLVPLSAGGADSSCKGPPVDQLTYTNAPPVVPGQPNEPDSYFWTSISTLPGSPGEAIAGGQLRTGPADDLVPHPTQTYETGEPVIVQTDCNGGYTVTRFVVQAASATSSTPATYKPDGDSGEYISALAASAVNDGWAATGGESISTPVRLFRLTDTTPPEAPAGNDVETRPLNLHETPPLIVFAPLPPPPLAPEPAPEPAPTPAPIVTATTKTLPPPIDHIKVKLHTATHTSANGAKTRSFTLEVSFTVVRNVTIGLEALRKGKVVATTGLKAFRPARGTLELPLKRADWPTKLRFLSDAPTVTLANPGSRISGSVTLGASASAIKGRHVTSVAFEDSPAGANRWQVIATVTAAPFKTQFDTSTLAPGSYDLRAVATDSAGVSAVSPTLPGVQIGGSQG
jgi:hypothetical protein